MSAPDLSGFARAILDNWPDADLLDTGDLQDIAVSHGLLVPVEVSEPCGENCFCSEFADAFPLTCYRLHASLTERRENPRPAPSGVPDLTDLPPAPSDAERTE